MTCYNSLETETAHNYNFKVNRAVPDWHCLEEESARCNNWESQSARQIHKFRKLPQYRALRTKATRHISVNDDQKQQNIQNNYTFISDHHLLQFTFWKLTNWHLGDIHDDSFYLESLSLASKRFLLLLRVIIEPNAKKWYLMLLRFKLFPPLRISWVQIPRLN